MVDPSPLLKNRCVNDDELAETSKQMTAAELDAARRRLETLVNTLIEASVSVLNDEERSAHDGSVGLDATPVPLFSRGPSKRAGRCASDPDGGWYVREGDHRDTWALEATIATTAPAPGADPRHPNLSIGLTLTRPGEDPGGTGARALASVVARGHRAGYLGADRAYTAALPERFHLPVAALGYQAVMDYRIDQLGIQAKQRWRHLGRANLVLPGHAGIAHLSHDRLPGQHHRLRHLPSPHRRPVRLPPQTQRRPRRRRLRTEKLPALGQHPGLMCPLRAASLTLVWPARRADQSARPTRRTTQSLRPDRHHHRPRHRRPPPPNTPLRIGEVGPALRHTAQHHRRTQRFLKDPAHEAHAQPARR